MKETFLSIRVPPSKQGDESLIGFSVIYYCKDGINERKIIAISDKVQKSLESFLGICVIRRAMKGFPELSTLFRPDEQDDNGPSEEDDQKNNELSDQFGVHKPSFFLLRLEMMSG